MIHRPLDSSNDRVHLRRRTEGIEELSRQHTFWLTDSRGKALVAIARTIEDLIFKGTHNSYCCRGGPPPRMNHPPHKQIDDFGVWALELDFSIENQNGGPVAVIGHNRPGDRSCWGYTLAEYAQKIRSAVSLRYRPVFLCFDVKSWKRAWFQGWGVPADRGFQFHEKWDCGVSVLREVCGPDLVILEELLREREHVWPTVPDLAGKIVLYEPNKRDEDGRLVGLRSTHANRCVSPSLVEDSITLGKPLERDGAFCEGGTRVPRLDQYQADWTFAYGVPPNPIVVDCCAPASTLVSDAEGGGWRCGKESSHGEVVGEHGTSRFPFRTLTSAVRRAHGVTLATGGRSDPRRAGDGWTLIVEPGIYEEANLDLKATLTVPVEEAEKFLR